MTPLYTEAHVLKVEPSGNVAIYDLASLVFVDKVHSMDEALIKVSELEASPFHTKGPWSTCIERSDLAMNGIGIVTVEGPKGIICNCEESSFSETLGNAKLIAAAPELLHALELLMTQIKDQGLQDKLTLGLSRAEYALSRAKGV